ADLSDLWLKQCYTAYNLTGYMYEKYNAYEVGVGGGGGEYVPQVGFGWSNAVALLLLKQTGTSQTQAQVRGQDRGQSLTEERAGLFGSAAPAVPTSAAPTLPAPAGVALLLGAGATSSSSTSGSSGSGLGLSASEYQLVLGLTIGVSAVVFALLLMAVCAAAYLGQRRGQGMGQKRGQKRGKGRRKRGALDEYMAASDSTYSTSLLQQGPTDSGNSFSDSDSGSDSDESYTTGAEARSGNRAGAAAFTGEDEGSTLLGTAVRMGSFSGDAVSRHYFPPTRTQEAFSHSL
ncbi:hypothetical protein B484DRAFT_436853, partial [Ochromonadaceae sp. CCMP2298]